LSDSFHFCRIAAIIIPLKNPENEPDSLIFGPDISPVSGMMGMVSCTRDPEPADKTAADILGDPAYLAISYGGYREITREIQPSIRQLKEDMNILSAMGIRVLRTYNVHYDEAAKLLEAISQMKAEDPAFEMYVMLGAWIDCKNAWTDLPDRIRDQESERNAVEIARAVELTLQYPDIVKVIAVGNEAMVHWAWNYYVEPGIILKWVNHLQDLKKEGVLPESLWITSSDNFASWGGGGSEYHVSDLESLCTRWILFPCIPIPCTTPTTIRNSGACRKRRSICLIWKKLMRPCWRARDYAISQYQSVVDYMQASGWTNRCISGRPAGPRFPMSFMETRGPGPLMSTRRRCITGTSGNGPIAGE
jgi:hypothetical protein